MKALHLLNNTEKGKLLADLFPEHIPDFLEFISLFYDKLQQQEKEVKATWNNPLFTAHAWYNIAESCMTIVRRYKNPKLMTSRVFSDQLFYGYNALFIADCIIKFADLSENRLKFKIAVDLLFKP